MKSALKPMLDSGHPPLSVPLTVSDLNKMLPQQAEELLRVELRRTMQKDEATGEQLPHPDTIKLIADYMASRSKGVDDYAM